MTRRLGARALACRYCGRVDGASSARERKVEGLTGGPWTSSWSRSCPRGARRSLSCTPPACPAQPPASHVTSRRPRPSPAALITVARGHKGPHTRAASPARRWTRRPTPVRFLSGRWGAAARPLRRRPRGCVRVFGPRQGIGGRVQGMHLRPSQAGDPLSESPARPIPRPPQTAPRAAQVLRGVAEPRARPIPCAASRSRACATSGHDTTRPRGSGRDAARAGCRTGCAGPPLGPLGRQNPSFRRYLALRKYLARHASWMPGTPTLQARVRESPPGLLHHLTESRAHPSPFIASPRSIRVPTRPTPRIPSSRRPTQLPSRVPVHSSGP